MSIESGPGPHGDFGSLRGCFVEGSAEQRARERHIRRRALIISVATQAAILTAIILVPLFGKPERIALAGLVPIPPYYHSNQPAQRPPEHITVRHTHITTADLLTPPTRIPTTIDPRPLEVIPEGDPSLPSGPGATSMPLSLIHI